MTLVCHRMLEVVRNMAFHVAKPYGYVRSNFEVYDIMFVMIYKTNSMSSKNILSH